MSLTQEQIAKYFARLSHSGSYDPDVKNLFTLHREHMLAVPFENLDIHYNRKIALNIERLYQKIVISNRGGFCYELNALFNELLASLGYSTKLVSARVANSEGGFGKEFDHMAIIVKTADSEFLADVGFGEFIFEPLRLEMNITQTDARGDFIIEQFDEKYLIVRKSEAGSKADQYLFTLSERNLREFEDMCEYHQTSPDSHFTKMKMITVPFEGGRRTLTEKKLKLTRGKDTIENDVSGEEEFARILKEKFKIEM